MKCVGFWFFTLCLPVCTWCRHRVLTPGRNAIRDAVDVMLRSLQSGLEDACLVLAKIGVEMKMVRKTDLGRVVEDMLADGVWTDIPEDLLSDKSLEVGLVPRVWYFVRTSEQYYSLFSMVRSVSQASLPGTATPTFGGSSTSTGLGDLLKKDLDSSADKSDFFDDDWFDTIEVLEDG